MSRNEVVDYLTVAVVVERHQPPPLIAAQIAELSRRYPEEWREAEDKVAALEREKNED